MTDFTRPLWLALIGSSLIMAAIAVSHSDKPDNATLPTIEQGCSDRIILKLVKSLRNDATLWSYDGYEVSKGMGWFDGPPIRIWVATGEHGLDLNTSENRFTMKGIDYPFTDSCRKYLYRETQRSRARNLSDRI